MDANTIAENRELDRLRIEAHAQRNVDKAMDLFVKGPDTFFIAPNGVLAMGWDKIRDSYAHFFAGLDSISADIKDVKYVRAGDGVIAVGTVVFHRKDKNAPRPRSHSRLDRFPPQVRRKMEMRIPPYTLAVAIAACGRLPRKLGKAAAAQLSSERKAHI